MSIVLQLYRPSNVQSAISEKLNIISDETPAGLRFSVDAKQEIVPPAIYSVIILFLLDLYQSSVNILSGGVL